MKQMILMCAALFVMGQTSFARAFDHDHGIWDIVLKKHVTMVDEQRHSRVNYLGIKNDVALFGTYIDMLTSVSRNDYEAWSRNRKLAFLINAYNALAIKLVVDHYPLDSIQDIGGLFTRPFDISFITLFGETMSLNDMESRLIRQNASFDDPRIFLVLFRAAAGSPALKNEAWTDETLEPLLEASLMNFLSDPGRNRFNTQKKRFEISPVFRWYEEDFKAVYGSISRLLHVYGDCLQLSAGEADVSDVPIVYLDFDWALNVH